MPDFSASALHALLVQRNEGGRQARKHLAARFLEGSVRRRRWPECQVALHAESPLPVIFIDE